MANNSIIYELTQSFIELHPTAKPHLVKKWMSKYYQGVLDELLETNSWRMMFANYTFNDIQFRKSLVNKNCGMITLPDGSRKNLFNYCGNKKGLVLTQDTLTGFQGVYSRVKVLPHVKKRVMLDLLDISYNKKYKFNQAYKRDYFDITPTHKTRINFERLQQHRLTTISILEDEQLDEDTENTLFKSALYATKLIAIAKEDEHGYYLDEEYNEVDSGRWYGKGHSLQRCNSNLRRASLGSCYQYDFIANSYAVLLSMAQDIDMFFQPPNLTAYVLDRKIVRKEIALNVGCSVEDIKKVFTSLGFGANVQQHSSCAIQQSIGYHKTGNLLNDTFFTTILSEIKEANKLLNTRYIGKKFTGYMNKVFDDSEIQYDEDGKKIRKYDRKKFAFIYQNAEAYIMGKFIDGVRSYTGEDPLLLVHDGVYYKQQIPPSVLITVMNTIIDEFRYVSIEETQFK